LDYAVVVRDARLRFKGTLLFDGLDIALERGIWTCLLGPSGVGKSSLLRVIAGLEKLEAGALSVPRNDRIAYMAQQDLLLPWLSAMENVALGARLRGERTDDARARAMLERVGLGGDADALPATLSGGMRQRVALARTLMEDRQIVLMDEPFSALDAITRMRLQELAVGLLAGKTVLLVTHDPLEALRLGDRIVVMAGRPAIVQPASAPDGVPPRAVADASIQRLYASLLAQLIDADAAGSAERRSA
jgi:putative hydroxymethylpyrimidine transport system ATP-binding protein